MSNIPVIDNAKSLNDLVRQLEQWRQTLLTILSFPPLAATKGVQITQTSGTGNMIINHGLRAVPRGWVVLKSVSNTPASISEVSSDKETLTLRVSTPSTVTLWIYALFSEETRHHDVHPDSSQTAY